MSKPSLDNFSIRAGKIITPEIVLIILEDSVLSGQDIPHSELAFWLKDRDWFSGSLDYNAISIASTFNPIENKYISMTIGDSGHSTEIIKGSISHNKISNGEGISSIRYINEKFIAVGIRGKVFDITDIHNHIDISSKLVKKNIESCCSYSTTSFLTCGWKGHITKYSSDRTVEKLESGTNVILTSIICNKNREIFVCGQKGVVLRGRKDSLKLLELGGITEDFWSIVNFQGEIYIASTTALYKLIDDETVELVKYHGEVIPTSFYHLDTFDDSLLLSIGQKDAVIFDGKEWIRIL